ncbi:hypothetical protein GCM10011415_05350 [Salipiger pallidus]|uniref:Uncharacterized protein n=1 Tax=Salipiger pallidus TaxID=1775170 RepID=A0A8J2ZGP4_9RHOB|nr:hypothetical protein [Salipiger pallidus]GGG62055.1 hypothetical protein GCM10011415_05350 [Salipiger pallidus]
MQGRLSLQILLALSWTPPGRPTVDALGWFHVTIARLEDFVGRPVMISRTGYTGALGVEVLDAPRDL